MIFSPHATELAPRRWLGFVVFFLLLQTSIVGARTAPSAAAPVSSSAAAPLESKSDLVGTSHGLDGLTTPQLSQPGTVLGLESQVVMALAQDRDGMIWVGTKGGLFRWDGYRTREFHHEPEDAYSVPSGNFVSGLLSDDLRGLWVATDTGKIAHYDPDGDRFAPFGAPFPGSNSEAMNVTGMATDGAGGLWVSGAHGLAHLDGKSGHWQIDSATGLADRRIEALLRDRSGALWVAGYGGVSRRPAGATSFETMWVAGDAGSSDLLSLRVTALSEDSEGRIWFGRGDGRIGRIDPASRKTELLPGISDSTHAIRCLLEARPGLFFIGRLGDSGLWWRAEDNQKMLRYDASRPSGLSDNFVNALLRDRSGLIWIGTGRGVDRYNPRNRAIESLLPGSDSSTGLSGADIRSVVQDSSGKVWFGNYSGIADRFDYDTGRITRMALQRQTPGLLGAATSAANEILALAPATDGGMWMGTAHGLYETHPGRDHAQFFKPFGDARAGFILAEPDGLWIGTYERGLAHLTLPERRLQFFNYDANDAESLSSSWVLSIMHDPAHGIWVGTVHGLNLLLPGGHRFRRFTHDPDDAASVPGDVITSLILDHRQRLWIGTQAGGIGIMEGDPLGKPSFRHLSIAEGLPSKKVVNLLADATGRIWAATDHGLAIIDPDSLSVRALGLADGVVIPYYNVMAGASMPDGTLLFGGKGGVTVVHPDLLQSWTEVPPVVVTMARSGTRNMSGSKTMVLQPGERSLQVEFAALDFTSPQKNHYAYQLEGFDNDWITSDAEHRMATYTNIPPGNYRLLLRGSNRHGVWTDPPTSVAVNVLPTWYQTLWFKLAVGMLSMVMVYALIQSRTALLRQRQKELEHLIELRTQELRVALEEQKQLATMDGLTRVANRRQFDLVLTQEVQRARRERTYCSLLLIDVDDFKAYNDFYGHQRGDDVLRNVASLTKAQLMRPADMVARYGGEEFVVILPNTDTTGAIKVAQSIVHGIHAAGIAHQSARAAPVVTVSIGVVTTGNQKFVSDQDLIGAADVALYEAKHAGRNQIAVSAMHV